MSPILEKVKSQLGEGVTILKVDVDKNPKVAAQYQVRGVPTLIIFKNGETKWRQSGVVSDSDLVGLLRQMS
jgi:thioredoxin 1